MYNLVHMFVAVLKELNIISDRAAQELSKKLSTKILPSTPEEASGQVAKVFEELKNELGADLIHAEPWLLHIEQLDRKVSALEQKLLAKTEVKKPVAVKK